MNKLALFLVALMIPVAAMAQGSGSVGPSGAGDAFGFDTTKMVKLTVIAVRPEGTIEVKDDFGRVYVAKVSKGLAVTAEKGTELSSQKKMKIDRLEPGMLIRATVRTSDNVLVAIRILKDAKAA